jgi:predicted flavoprotein YhiN
VQEARHAGIAVPLAQLVKSLPLRLVAPGSLARAISTAGGIKLEELDGNLMLRRRPGVFAAGEMLDWEAPTGGYLLQACLATGLAAGRGVLAWRAQAAGG